MFESLREWRLRRKRFSEEWGFHRDQLKAELTAFGLSRREMREIVRRRLGRKSRWRCEALKEIGGDWRSLVQLLNTHYVGYRPWLAPASITLALIILFICNPWRGQMLTSLLTEPHEYLPLRNMVVVRADFARCVWGVILLTGVAWLVSSRKGLRISLYASLLLVLIAAFAVSLWIAAVQVSIAIEWPSDLLQGFVILGFFFAYFWGSLLAMKRWRKSIAARCPICLRRLRLPASAGRSGNLLLHPVKFEYICLEGHGALTENYWTSRFRPSDGFWRDLAKTS